MQQEKPTKDDIKHNGAKEKLEQFVGNDSELLYIWYDSVDNYPVYRISTIVKSSIYFVRIFPKINRDLDSIEGWNISVDRDINNFEIEKLEAV